jgi:hypothetical protein
VTPHPSFRHLFIRTKDTKIVRCSGKFPSILYQLSSPQESGESRSGSEYYRRGRGAWKIFRNLTCRTYYTTVYSLRPTSKLDGRQRQKARETIQAGESFRVINVPSVGRARGGNEAIGAEDETQHYSSRVWYIYCPEVQQSHWKALQSMIHRHKTYSFTIVVASNSTVLQHLSFPQRRSIKYSRLQLGCFQGSPRTHQSHVRSAICDQPILFLEMRHTKEVNRGPEDGFHRKGRGSLNSGYREAICYFISRNTDCEKRFHIPRHWN